MMILSLLLHCPHHIQIRMNCKLDLNIHKVKDNHQAILKIMFCLRHVNIVEELHLTVTMDTYCFALS